MGNSLAFRIPSAIAKQMNIVEGQRWNFVLTASG